MVKKVIRFSPNRNIKVQFLFKSKVFLIIKINVKKKHLYNLKNNMYTFDVADGCAGKTVYLIEGLLWGVGFETDLRNGNRGVGASA